MLICRFADIPVGKPASQVDISQLQAESYIDAPEICQYGGHVVVQIREQVQRYGAGEIRDVKLLPEDVILAVQPYIPEISGVTERGSLIQEGYSITSNTIIY